MGFQKSRLCVVILSLTTEKVLKECVTIALVVKEYRILKSEPSNQNKARKRRT